MMLRFYAMTAENVSVSLEHFPFFISHLPSKIGLRVFFTRPMKNEKC